jgi:hypothetical protein
MAAIKMTIIQLLCGSIDPQGSTGCLCFAEEMDAILNGVCVTVTAAFSLTLMPCSHST